MKLAAFGLSLLVVAAIPRAQERAQPTPRTERFWLAGQYDGNRVIVYFDAVKFGDTFPEDARTLPDPVTFGFFTPKVLPASFIARFRSQPNFERFRVGDQYELLGDAGGAKTITITTLIGFESDEAVGNDSYIGALARVKGTSPLLSTKGYYAVRRPIPSTREVRDRSTAPAGLSNERVRFDLQTQLAELLEQRMRRQATEVEQRAIGRTPAALVVQPFHVADGSLRYYVRAEWRWGESGGGEAGAFSLAAWVATTPLRMLATESATSGDAYGFDEALPDLLNVVDLGRGRTGIIVHIFGLDSMEFGLYEYRDGASLSDMNVLHSIGVGE